MREGGIGHLGKEERERLPSGGQREGSGGSLTPRVDVNRVTAVTRARRATVEKVLDGEVNVGGLRPTHDLDPIV